MSNLHKLTINQNNDFINILIDGEQLKGVNSFNFSVDAKESLTSGKLSLIMDCDFDAENIDVDVDKKGLVENG